MELSGTHIFLYNPEMKERKLAVILKMGDVDNQKCSLLVLNDYCRLLQVAAREAIPLQYRSYAIREKTNLKTGVGLAPDIALWWELLFSEIIKAPRVLVIRVNNEEPVEEQNPGIIELASVRMKLGYLGEGRSWSFESDGYLQLDLDDNVVNQESIRALTRLLTYYHYNVSGLRRSNVVL